MSRRTRRVVTALVAGTFALTGAGVAHAAIKGNAAATQNVTSASWGAKATANDGTSALALTWDGYSGTLAGARYFRVVNTGTVALTAATFNIAVNKVNNNGNNVPPTNFDVCVGGDFNTTTGLCATNNIVTIMATTTTKFTVSGASTYVPAVGGYLSMRAQPTASSFNQPFTATIDMTVSGTQVRARTTTNS